MAHDYRLVNNFISVYLMAERSAHCDRVHAFLNPGASYVGYTRTSHQLYKIFDSLFINKLICCRGPT
jgi:hypothetical protein